MKIKNNIKKGFTLIELMITVAIVGILSSIALPAYQDYTIRAQMAEGFNLVSGAKTFVVDYYTNTGELPESTADIGLPSTVGKYVSSIELVDGTVEVIYSSTAPHAANTKIEGKKVFFKPEVSATDNLNWICSSDADTKYLPTSCK